MSEPKRLHPATIIFNLVMGIRSTIFVFILIFVTLNDTHLFYAILAVVLLVGFIFLGSFLSWHRYTYRVEGDELRLEYGILIRKKRYISKNRIQSIDLTQNILHRIFKLVKVEIETAGTGAEAEASLIAVTLEQGEALRAELKSITKDEQVEEVIEINNLSQSISRKRLLIAGATSGRIGVLLALGGAAFSELERFIPTDFYDQAYSWVIGLGLLILAVMIVAVLLFLWIIGIAGTMIKYWNFTITKVDEDIVIKCGLLEKKHITIPLKRIQAVGHAENIVRQPLGYTTVIAEIAGGSNENGEQFSTVLFPLMKVEEVDTFLAKFLPGYLTNRSEIIPLPKRSLKYYLVRATVPILLLLVAVIILFPQFLWIPVVLLTASILLGFLQYKDSGYVIEGERVTLSYRIFSKVTMIINHKRIQAFNKKQHFLHRKEHLATIKLSIIGKMGTGKHYYVKELDEQTVEELEDWYSYRGG
ncbi:PH domain-containing protein [Paucisalibacillus sp. EB02]|uniref:PH domain-containing protein n=1 Tax=Paucisalibacillus sp. EB02 TaxID=1347087 RepID=UPI0004AF61E9|nr:PH domain-containing protein [Paucisalibacillus sp. EB02]